MSTRKPRFFVRIARKYGADIEPNVEFKTLAAAKTFAKELIAKHPDKYSTYAVYES